MLGLLLLVAAEGGSSRSTLLEGRTIWYIGRSPLPSRTLVAGLRLASDRLGTESDGLVSDSRLFQRSARLSARLT